MDFHKVETTSNFVFGGPDAGTLSITDHGSSVFRVTAASKRWPRGTDSHAVLTPEEFKGTTSKAKLTAGSGGELTLSLNGTPILESASGRGFGVCGPKWVLAFRYLEADRFYGLGEKHLGLELSNVRTKFWNTDEFGDFPPEITDHGRPDPSYSSFPVLIVKHEGLWAAAVIDNPHGVFVNTGADEPMFQPGGAVFTRELFFGSRDGAPDVWFIADESPVGLVRKIQTLQGRTPLPPVWALGHHQCRWGYKGPADLAKIADGFAKHGIPNDGLWLDIDYMDGYRVFTTSPQHFGDTKAQLEELAERGHRVVPILDPGFRQDPEYKVYAEAKKLDLLCRTPEGGEYVGFVWPGYTVFPDFSLPEAREFWSKQVKELTDKGFGGYWIDMNDPSTGSVPHHDMLFGRGKLPHSSYHNQYALGMAEGTRRGMQQSRPGQRTFILARSAYLSSSRHTAVWTGDNVSNEFHMRNTVALTLNLSVSGMPFNGPDVPGFAGDASSELMRAWYKLGFLFPVLRNHSIKDSVPQEPWSRDGLTTSVVSDYIRLRYKLLPYLYQNFVAQYKNGDPMLRPVWYHDASPAFEKTDDLFFVGPNLLQAPFTSLKDKTRTVTLPQHANGTRWYDVQNQAFVSAGDTTKHRNEPATTPLFLASPSALPLQRGMRRTNANDFRKLDVLLVLEEGTARLDYQLDDGLTEAWQQGTYSQFVIEAKREGESLSVAVTSPVRVAGGLALRFLVLGSKTPVALTVNGKPFGLSAESLAFAGKNLPVRATVEIEL